MRIAIVSDIHANLQAWKAVWLDIRSMAVDRVISLGDVVGYGPSPADVLEAVWTSIDYFALGNHDAAICGKIDTEFFNDTARALIKWTSAQLAARAVQELSKWPMTIAGEGFRCAHGEFGHPALFRYVLEAQETEASWRSTNEPLLFIGHTHYPCLHVLGASGTPHMLEPQDFALENGKRYMINVGSVGHPRDGDPRASYCIYDTAEAAVFWRRIPFDLDAYYAALQKTDIPAAVMALIAADPRKTRAPLRETVPFHPPDRAEQAARDTIKVRYIEGLRRRIRRWQKIAMLVSAMLMALIIIAGAISVRQARREMEIASAPMPELNARATALGANLLMFPETPIPANQPVPGWRIQLGNRYTQQAAWQPDADHTSGWQIRSDSMAPLHIESPLINVAQNMKFTMQGRIRKSAEFKGSLALAIVLERRLAGGDDPHPRLETIQHFVVKEPAAPKSDGWSAIKHTFDIPANAQNIRFQIRGRFEGAATLSELRLERKK